MPHKSVNAFRKFIACFGIGLISVSPLELFATSDHYIHSQVSRQSITDYGYFGTTIEISGDTMAIGVPYSYSSEIVHDHIGAVVMFTRNIETDAWEEQQVLVPSDATYGQKFGEIMALDGDTLIVGDPLVGSGLQRRLGAFYIFKRDESDGRWIEVGKKSAETPLRDMGFGSALAIRGDVIAVSANLHETLRQISIYQKNATAEFGWEWIRTIDDPEPDNLSNFGSSLGLSENYVLVGDKLRRACNENQPCVNFSGAAYIFNLGTNGEELWVEPVKLMPNSPESFSEFGFLVQLQGDSAYVASPGYPGVDSQANSGKVFEFRQDPDDSRHWPQVSAIDTTALSGPVRFGQDFLVAENVLAIGAPHDNQSQGAVHLFTRDDLDTDNWIDSSHIKAAEGIGGENFGTAVAIHDDELLIGSPQSYHTGGAVFISPIFPEQERALERHPPLYPIVGSLEDDGEVYGYNGITVEAVDADLDQPVDIWIHDIDPPAEFPFDDQTSLLSSYIAIGARNTQVAEAGHFSVIFPVPDGVDTDHLAVALSSDLPDNFQIDQEDDPGWEFIGGSFDQSSQTFSISVNRLDDSGARFVLIENPIIDFALMRTFTLDSGIQFNIHCMARHILTGEERCDDEIIDRVQDMLTIASINYETFNLPLTRPIIDVNLVPCFLKDELAWFRNENERIYFCLSRLRNENVTAAEQQVIVNHEYFHAVQWGYRNRRDAEKIFKTSKQDIWGLRNRWISESTAVTASYILGHNFGVPDREPHRIDIPLDASASEGRYAAKLDNATQGHIRHKFPAYRAWSFWYFLLRSNHDATRLESVLDQGVNNESLNSNFPTMGLGGGLPPDPTALASEYWAWAKEVALEHQIPELNIVNPCILDARVAPRSKYHHFDTGIGNYFPGRALKVSDFEEDHEELLASGSLRAMTSRVFEIKYDADLVGNGDKPDVSVEVIVEGMSDVANYKVLAGVPGQELHGFDDDGKMDGCIEGKEGRAKIKDLQEGEKLYILLSHTLSPPGSTIEIPGNPVTRTFPEEFEYKVWAFRTSERRNPGEEGLEEESEEVPG